MGEFYLHTTHEKTMRKLIVLSFISLDGVVQAPGGPQEDPEGGFQYGGWVAPFFEANDTEANAMMSRQLQPADLLLGRKTYEIFAGYWPDHGDIWPGVNAVAKYVVSSTMTQADWNNTSVLRGVEDIQRLKAAGDADLQVHGSGKLVQALLAHDLVDELWLKIYPLVLGRGKRLFGEGSAPAAFTLTESLVTANGVIFANYTRAGAVRTGTIGA